MLLTLNLRQGIYKNGTPYSRRTRWGDGNLVRWHDGSIRPIGGWLRRQNSSGVDIATLIADSSLEAVRDIYSWRDNTQTQHVVFGSNLKLKHLSASGAITDITYAGYAAINSSKNASVQAGYGQNPYGVGAYGTVNNLIGQAPIPPDRWYFSNFGEILLTGVRRNGGVYAVDPSTLTPVNIGAAPSPVQDLCVTEQRQVFTVGANGEPRRVQVSDVEDYNEWTPAIDNQVVDRVIPGTGKLLRCIQVLRQVLLLGENDAYTATYIGPPYVYGVNLVGEKCGPLCAEAVATTDKFAVWWGDRNFWLYDGSIQSINCDVIDFLHDDLDPIQVSKTQAFTVSDFSEIWWLYQSVGSTTGEVDKYVAWDYKDNHWIVGSLDRTAGVGKGVTTSPIMVSSDGYIYNHEQDLVFPMGDVYVTSGPIDIAQGEVNVAVSAIYPDTQEVNDVTFELLARQFPNDVEYTYGPYAYANPVMTRALGRSIRLKANFQSATSELGVLRLEHAGKGTGKR